MATGKIRNITVLVENEKYRIDIEHGRRRDGSRNRLVETFYGTEKQAIQRRDELKYELKHSKIRPDGNMKFLDYAKFWIKEYAEENVRETTLYSYKCNLNAHILPKFKDYKLKDIKVYDLEKFYKELSKRPTKATQNKEKGQQKMLSSTTVLKQHRLLSLMFNTAVKWEFLDSNPCMKVLKPPTKDTPEMNYFSEQEIKELFRILDSEELGFKTAVYVLLLGGARRAELLGIHWDDVDFTNHTVSIERDLLDIRKKGIIEDDTKTSKSKRVITLPNICFQLLEEYKQLQDDRKRAFGSNWVDSDYVFQKELGGCMKPDWLSRHWKQFLEKNNFKKIRLHDLRHTCATYFISIGTPIATVSRKLGHSNIYTTLNTYTHSLEEDDKKAVSELENRLFK